MELDFRTGSIPCFFQLFGELRSCRQEPRWRRRGAFHGWEIPLRFSKKNINKGMYINEGMKRKQWQIRHNGHVQTFGTLDEFPCNRSQNLVSQVAIWLTKINLYTMLGQSLHGQICREYPAW